MSFNQEIYVCREEGISPSCTKEKFMQEFLSKKTDKAVAEATAAAKAGETLKVDLPSLTLQEEKFAQEYFRQLTWKAPFLRDISHFADIVKDMSPAQSAAYVRKQLAQKIDAPKIGDYDPSVKDLMEQANAEGISNHPDWIASENLSLANYYRKGLRQAAIEYFDEHKMYDNVREFAKDLPAGQYSQSGRNYYMERPEIALSSAQKIRALEIFDQIDADSNGRLSAKELDQAMASKTTSQQDREMLKLLQEFRTPIAHSYDDSVLLPEWNISRQDLKHIGEHAPYQPGKGLKELEEYFDGRGGPNPWLLM